MLERLNLRIRVFLFFAALAAGGIGAVVAGIWVGFRRYGDPEALSAFIFAGGVAGFAILALVAWIWFLFDEHVARAIQRLAGGMRATVHAEGARPFDPQRARYLGDLAPAAAAVSESLSDTRNALAEAVQRETTRLAAEKERLETLLSDVNEAVVLCSAEHQLVFYNGVASGLLGAGLAPGLDRPVFDFLREAPLRHAYERLCATDDADAVSDLLAATADGARVLSGRMRLLAGAGAMRGYVLTLRDVTSELAQNAARDRFIAELFDRVRRPAAGLGSVIGLLAEDEGLRGDARMTAALLEEAGRLVGAVTELGQRYDEARGGWRALPVTRGFDLLDGARARIEAAGIGIAAEGADLLVRCDGYQIVALLAGLARRLAEAGMAREFRLTLAEDGAGAVFDLDWQGKPAGLRQLDAWLAEPVDRSADVTGADILAAHACECWPERRPDGRARLRLPLREARRAAGRPAPIQRAVVYDFDLLFKARNERIAETRLEDLVYVVFDTETTGLLPSEGDEIVQLAAVRIVNGRRVAGEVLDTLVNPGRAIPPRSTAVHGISDAMVAGAPDIVAAGRRFRNFAAGAVLVAHNAPFDMEFLRRHEAAIGGAFDNPILDTVLLSAVVFGQDEGHSLDALTHRLGIFIPEEARHTAIGDTEATADALLRLIQMLKARGVHTFGDVLAEVRRHGRLLKDLNA